MSQDSLVIARNFASSLDAEDYATTALLLAEDCVYHIGDATLVGREAILASYQKNGQSAKQRFDAIEYTSHVEMTAPTRAVVSFTDGLHLGNRAHEFRCRQHLDISPTGLITHIQHEEIPGERQRLKDFEEYPSPISQK